MIRVIDGDTFIIQDDDEELRIRLIGVDTPETVHPNKPIQQYGKEASDFSKKLEGIRVYITFDQTPIDKYGRTL